MAHKHLPVSLANPSQSPIWSSLSLPLPCFWFPHCERSTGQMHHQTKVSHIPTQTNTEIDPQVVYSSNPHQPLHTWLNPKTTMESISFVFFPRVSFHLFEPQYSILLYYISIRQMWLHVCIYLQLKPWIPQIITDYSCFTVNPSLCQNQTFASALVSIVSLETRPN